MVKLDQFLKRKPHQLSGGQRQRVALARSLIKRPKLLLLDEPLGALDKKLREHTQFELVNIQEKLGVTFVVVTHDQEEAMTLASRIGVMNHGRIVQVGTPHEIYEFPGTRFVSEFIGNVNIFEGRIMADEPDHVTIESQELGCADLRRARREHGAPMRRVWAAVRPEKIMITRDGAERRRSACRRPMLSRERRAAIQPGAGCHQGDRLHGRHLDLHRAARLGEAVAGHAAEQPIGTRIRR